MGDLWAVKLGSVGRGFQLSSAGLFCRATQPMGWNLEVSAALGCNGAGPLWVCVVFICRWWWRAHCGVCMYACIRDRQRAPTYRYQAGCFHSYSRCLCHVICDALSAQENYTTKLASISLLTKHLLYYNYWNAFLN